tara:strand:- start:9331 stop:9600 length:270 start_codon:yes stop_codon:yes gene_type:complete
MTEMIRWEPTKFEAQAGKFSSQKRYVRKVASGGYGLATGASVTGRYVIDGVNKGVSMRFKIPGYLDAEYVFLSGTNAAEPTPTVQAVEI